MGALYDSMLPPETVDLRPLPPVLQQGLTALSVVGCISLFSSSALFCHLTFKIVRWKQKTAARSKAAAAAAAAAAAGSIPGSIYHEPLSPTMDLALGLAERHFHVDFDTTSQNQIPQPLRKTTGIKLFKKWPLWAGRKQMPPSDDATAAQVVREKAELNQFLLLLYNLLLADMHQSLAFMLNAVWVKNDAFIIKSSTCWSQGFFVSNGDLSASLFIAAIAIHTYSVISRGYKPPQWVVNAACISIWVFTYGLALIGIAATRNGATSDGFYVRASAWCWINQQFETLRLVTHYLFIFITLALTSLLYTLVFLSLRRKQKLQQRQQEQRLKLAPNHSLSQFQASKSSVNIRLAPIAIPSPGPASPIIAAVDLENNGNDNNNETAMGDSLRHPGFLIYPIIYVVCTLPLALGRIATMAGAEVPLGYFCAAGALITSNGWLDVLLWGSTRRNIVFGDVGEEDVGVNTFAFMRTPPNRRFGNMVWVEGGVNNRNSSNRTNHMGQFKHTSSHESSNTSSRMDTSRYSQSSSQDRGSSTTPIGEAVRGVRDIVLRGPRGWRELGTSSLGVTGLGIGSGDSGAIACWGGGGLAIQMEMETSVVVEIETAPQTPSRLRAPSTSMPAYDEKDMPDLPPIQ
ncbi:hypothetical protein SPBR_02494 [Sporothrix brasiliensis 5110]|uniref:Uncharacterized protein n=1 Tax=Sporothrix brasiliensis 5110 TaxID=1398154 RepID=A0A0C2ITR2_9PEZI|nr:uncharacterized protein SPBR_02494 [Sporothrix brasiliensis 5110]KIH92481.1 hypothetical protein SPBR_02494 [Sporothrix brasiliensis 5110]